MIPVWSGNIWYCFINSQWVCSDFAVRSGKNDNRLSASKFSNVSNVGCDVCQHPTELTIILFFTLLVTWCSMFSDNISSMPENFLTKTLNAYYMFVSMLNCEIYSIIIHCGKVMPYEAWWFSEFVHFDRNKITNNQLCTCMHYEKK